MVTENAFSIPGLGRLTVDAVLARDFPTVQGVILRFSFVYRSLNPRRTIQDSIIEGPVNFGMAKEEAIRKATELMSLVRLPLEALARYPHQFSGGQRQRIAIARALAMQPEVLIADEAVSALDVSVQKQVLEVLEDAQKRFDLAILFITHDLRVAAQICDHVLVMKSGTVVKAGRTFDVFNSPRDAYTRKLLQASPGHNFELASAQAL